MTKLVNLMAILFVALALVTVLDASAWAFGDFCSIFPRLCGVVEVPPPAPEIDPSLVRGTLAVLAGGVLMLAGRRRRRS